ncbi:hypothetical protein K5V21_02210 [Clostridium sardiniense]|uniref:Uncharacterized protein n=1 Tax=Clostridium sardiniense TaxID=29369 RepID=A0ABS7KTV6_CLOSR|nr:hypothetical protein [Clostridium sardiniense]MBY0754260.1 hypothetical protein [Clostridium sardiniense]MDQ0461237.1 hypothetical protein [Clostridium sardiniense]
MNTKVNDNQDKVLYSLANDVNLFLSSNPGKYFTSHEIDAMLNSVSYSHLKATLMLNDRIASSDPSKYIDSICSYLSKKRIIKHSKKICPYEHKTADAFSNC